MGLLETFWGTDPVKTTSEFALSTSGLLETLEKARKKKMMEEGLQMLRSLYSGGPINIGDPDSIMSLPDDKKQTLMKLMSLDPDVMTKIVDLMGIYQNVLGNPVPEPIRNRLKNIAGIDMGEAGAPAKVFQEMIGAAAEAPTAAMGPAGGLLKNIANMAIEGKHQLTVPAGGAVYNIFSGKPEFENPIPEKPAPPEKVPLPKPPPEMSPNQAYRNVIDLIKSRYRDITGDVRPEDRPFKEFVEEIAIGNELYLGGNKAVSSVNGLIREIDRYSEAVKKYENKHLRKGDVSPNAVKDFAAGMFVKKVNPASLEKRLISSGWSPEEARSLLKEAAERIYRLKTMKLRRPQEDLTRWDSGD